MERTLYTKSLFAKWFNKWKIHIITWAIFICYEILISAIFTGRFGTLSNYFIHYVLNISLFYVNAHIVLKNGLSDSNHAIWKLPLFIVLEIFIYSALSYLIEVIVVYYTDYKGIHKLEISLIYFSGPIFRCIYLSIFSTGYYFFMNFYRERKKTITLEQAKLHNEIQIAKSENAYLKAQINPHFLFNTLNFIYLNASEKSPIAAETILSLSNMMRYSIDSAHDGDFVELGREIEQIENLLNLHQLREEHRLQIRFDYDEGIDAIPIIPLVLTTLAENVFKHGNLINPTAPAEVNIHKIDSDLVITTSNLINPKPIKQGLNSGITNIKKRLNFIYGKKAILRYEIDEQQYFKLELILKEIV